MLEIEREVEPQELADVERRAGGGGGEGERETRRQGEGEGERRREGRDERRCARRRSRDSRALSDDAYAGD